MKTSRASERSTASGRTRSPRTTLPNGSAWTLKRTVQCAKCPWRKDVDPHDIPNGYSETKHRALKATIAKPGDVAGIFSERQQIMACHETHDAHCIGWLVNQIGAGNNIAMRIQIRYCANADAIRTVGEQHERFEDTLP